MPELRAALKARNWRLWQNRVPVTFRRAADPLTDYTFSDAKRRPLKWSERQPAGGAYQQGQVVWLVPVEVVELSSGGDWEPRPADMVTEAGPPGVTYTVLEAELRELKTYWWLRCVDLVLANGLTQSVDVEVPTVTQSATGAQVRAWAAKYTGLSCRVQPQEQEEFTGRGKKAPRVKFFVYVAQQIDPRNAAGDWGRVKHGSLYYQITGYRAAERIDELPVVECELLPG
jgi:hypothetical protein